MNYPARSRASDELAQALFEYLAAAEAPSDGEFRCTLCLVVTEREGQLHRVVIASSGPSMLLPALREAARALSRQQAFSGLKFEVDAQSGAHSVVDPLSNGRDERSHSNRSHCAEPRALEAAASYGDPIVAMSSLYWGKGRSPLTDLLDNPDNLFVRPCPRCMSHEAVIMQAVEHYRQRCARPRRVFEI